MPEAARGNQTDTVQSQTGTGRQCRSPVQTSTNECSPNVFVNGKGSVRIGDKVTIHNRTGCSQEQPGLSSASSNVFVNGKGMGRKGDNYQGDGTNIITSGSSNVFVGG